MKRLIINADDFGLTRGVNRAIVEAHQSGLVTSTTMMANGAEFDDAVALACEHPRLAVGCHVDLIQLAPTLPASELKSLTEGDHFRRSLTRFAADAMRGALRAEEITSEAVSQIRRLQNAGIRVSHFDTHKHTHVFPPVLRALLKAARACGVRAVRNPFEPQRVATVVSRLANVELLKRTAAVLALRPMASRFRRQTGEEGFATTDGTLGIAFTGHLSQAVVCELIRRMPEGTWELVTHPGYTDDGLAGLSNLTASREVELQLLTSDETRRSLSDCGVELISYAGLAA